MFIYILCTSMYIVACPAIGLALLANKDYYYYIMRMGQIGKQKKCGQQEQQKREQEVDE